MDERLFQTVWPITQTHKQTERTKFTRPTEHEYTTKITITKILKLSLQ